MPEPSYAGDVSPAEAWRILQEDQRAKLVDVRSLAEWQFVGLPDLSSLGKETLCISWQVYPTMQVNQNFVGEVSARDAAPEDPLFFLCRSGQRSRAAAMTMTAAGYQRCYNVAGGFEGDPDGERHRGKTNGWKVEGLPWVQS